MWLAQWMCLCTAQRYYIRIPVAERVHRKRIRQIITIVIRIVEHDKAAHRHIAPHIVVGKPVMALRYAAKDGAATYIKIAAIVIYYPSPHIYSRRIAGTAARYCYYTIFAALRRAIR